MVTLTRKHFLVSLAILSGLTLGGLARHAAWAAPDPIARPIKIGVIGPMSGPNAPYGSFEWRGASLATAQINAAGGILGRKVELVRGDSECTPVEAVLAAQRMISKDHVPFMLGDICSAATLALEPIVENAKVVLLNAASSDPDITYKAGVGGYHWTFRNYPTDEQRAGIVLKYATQRQHLHKFAILAVDNDYGRGEIKLSKKYFGRYGIKVTSEDYFEQSTTNFLPVLTKIKASGAKAILMYGYGASTRLIARQMVELGMAGKVTLVGNGDYTESATIQAAPSALEGAIEAAAWSEKYDNARSLKFVSEYKAAYHGESPNVHAYTHWETMYLLAAAIRKAGTTSPAAVRKALAGITYKGATGAVTFDSHHQADLPMILYRVEHGKPVIKGIFRSKVVYPKA